MMVDWSEVKRKLGQKKKGLKHHKSVCFCDNQCAFIVRSQEEIRSKEKGIETP